MTVNITVSGTTYPVPSNASDTNWAAQQVAFEQALAAAVSAPTWIAVSVFANSWTNFNSSTQLKAAYYKDSAGTVHVRGVLSSGSTGTDAFTLPSGYRPTKQEIFMVATSGGMCQVTILADGRVFIGADLGAGDPVTATHICGVNFSTVATT